MNCRLGSEQNIGRGLAEFCFRGMRYRAGMAPSSRGTPTDLANTHEEARSFMDISRFLFFEQDFVKRRSEANSRITGVSP
ncbi:MAG TPA: hypothetical protein VFE47_11720, partial [Tepidisphaeraceae bacterium]|nr:hypothetical protein [Tepidisphaeraceae bacterium]